MQYEKILEGGTKLIVPKSGAPSKKDEVFYNPHMELNRDISVALVKILNPEVFCDLMAGTGARGIRVANEADVKVVLNDANPTAVKMIRENALLNNLDVDVENLNHRVFLAGRKFDYIDLDPFGPPVEYAGSVFQSITQNGFIGVTATDTSALCGTYPKACLRKYGATSVRTDYYDELGLRILLGFLASTGLRHGFGVEFLFSHSTRHYFRTYLRACGKSKNIRETSENITYLQHCFKCLWRRYRKLGDLKENCDCGGELKTAGPVWRGRYADDEVCKKLHDEFFTSSYGSRREAVGLIEKVSQEQAIILPYYNLHKAFKKLRMNPLKTKTVLESLETQGFKSCETHFQPLGVKTDAPNIMEALRK
ncbi:MAG TPA: tRNA (guanine(10)-N(2))-dimethyltransferase [Candidatus Altiarchaeales archaeon]|nr:tRNA (guanine(10)-N(2))-dimethyltransferase [Candidatus Altiarchaeales archaeon]